MARVKTKRAYEPKAPGDGTRVLVMRLWPRGIKKNRVNVWFKELGAEVPLPPGPPEAPPDIGTTSPTCRTTFLN